jgi:hypothetical protein
LKNSSAKLQLVRLIVFSRPVHFLFEIFFVRKLYFVRQFGSNRNNIQEMFCVNFDDENCKRYHPLLYNLIHVAFSSSFLKLISKLCFEDLKKSFTYCLIVILISASRLPDGIFSHQKCQFWYMYLFWKALGWKMLE